MGKRRILLADDVAGTRRAVREILERQGFEVFEAIDGDDALAKAVVHKPDLIILDVMMPTRSGLEVAASLKSREEYKSIPILLFTSVPMTKDRGEDYWKSRTFADDFLSKPAKGRDIMERVERLLSRPSG